MTDMRTKACRACQRELPMTAYDARRNDCRECTTKVREAKAARTAEKRAAAVYTPELAERICDALAAGMTLSEVAEQSWAPTLRQLVRWRRERLEFQDALDAAREQRAELRSDRIDATLNDLRAGKISAADARTILDGEFKLMSLENAKFNPAMKVQAEVKQTITEEPMSDREFARWLAFKLNKGAQTIEVSHERIPERASPGSSVPHRAALPHPAAYGAGSLPGATAGSAPAGRGEQGGAAGAPQGAGSSRERLANGVTIVLERDEYGSGKAKWGVYGPSGDLLGYRLERATALKLAESVRPVVDDPAARLVNSMSPRRSGTW